MPFNPGGTLNVNSANAAQQFAPAPGSPPPMPSLSGQAVLQIIDGNDRGKQYPISPGAPCTIGRAPTCVCSLNDPGVSGHHATVGFDGPHLVVADAGSRNGVFLNNQKVQKHPVRNGDLIVIGSTRMMVRVA